MHGPTPRPPLHRNGEEEQATTELPFPTVAGRGMRGGGHLSRRRALHLMLVGAGAALGLAACQPARLVRRDPSRRLVLRINLHGSAAYAPLLLLRERRMLEEALPGLSVEWKVIPAAEDVNE